MQNRKAQRTEPQEAPASTRATHVNRGTTGNAGPQSESKVLTIRSARANLPSRIGTERMSNEKEKIMSSLKNSRMLLMSLLALVLIVALACSSDDEPAPAAPAPAPRTVLRR